jgi:hypothetical protein
MGSRFPIEQLFSRISSEVELQSFVERFHLKPLKASAPSRKYVAEWTGSFDGKAVFSRHRRLSPTAPSGSAGLNALSLSISAPDGTPLCRAEVRFNG